MRATQASASQVYGRDIILMVQRVSLGSRNEAQRQTEGMAFWLAAHGEASRAMPYPRPAGIHGGAISRLLRKTRPKPSERRS